MFLKLTVWKDAALKVILVTKNYFMNILLQVVLVCYKKIVIYAYKEWILDILKVGHLRLMQRIKLLIYFNFGLI